MAPHILLIDDSDRPRHDLGVILRENGFTCCEAPDGEKGLQVAQQEVPDVVVCDLMMPGLSGVDVVERLATSSPETNVIVVTGFASLETALEAFRRGASDYILKPVDPDEIIWRIRRCIEFGRIQREISVLRRQVSEGPEEKRLVSASLAMARVHSMIVKLADASSTVLVSGETGVGKGLVARTLHEAGSRREKPFVAVNCAALPRHLFESTLFGHVRGAFTGAEREKAGFFEAADGGTLFLDEIAEVPLELQAKLLRAIEEKEVVRVGSTRPIPTDVRIIAATNRLLSTEMKEGRFREDLYFRICVVEVPVPPLRSRKDDIPILVEHLIRRLNARLGRSVLGVDNEAMQVLVNAHWRGNVRELENILERGILLSNEEYLGIRDLPAEMSGTLHFPKLSDDLRASLHAYEAQHIRQVLNTTAGNREEAARRLGVNPSTLWRRIKALQIAT